MPVTFAQPLTALSEQEQDAPLVFDRRGQSCDFYRCACGRWTVTVPDWTDWRCEGCGTGLDGAVLLARVRNDPPKEAPDAQT